VWKWTLPLPGGNQYPMSVNIQVSPESISVNLQTQGGALEGDAVTFEDGVLNCVLQINDGFGSMQVKMRQDGNIDVTIDWGSGPNTSSIGSRG
jgi:hypothetical protein